MFKAGSIGAYLSLDSSKFVSSLNAVKGKLATLNTMVRSVAYESRRLGVSLTLVGAGAGGVVKSFATAAAAAEESENLFDVAMGSMSTSARSWSESLATAVGRDAVAIRGQLGVFDMMTTSMGFSDEAALSMSESLTQLTMDVSSLRNIPVEDAFTKLTAGLSGEIEPLRRLGIDIREYNVEHWALTNNLMQEGEQLTELGKIWSRYNVIIERTKKDQDDLYRTQDSLTNLTRSFTDHITMLKRELGSLIEDQLKSYLYIGRSVADAVSTWAKAHEDLAGKLTKVALGIAVFSAIAGPLLFVLPGLAEGFLMLTRIMPAVASGFIFIAGSMRLWMVEIAAGVAVVYVLRAVWNKAMSNMESAGEKFTSSTTSKFSIMENSVVKSTVNVANYVSRNVMGGLYRTIDGIIELLKYPAQFIWNNVLVPLVNDVHRACVAIVNELSDLMNYLLTVIKNVSTNMEGLVSSLRILWDSRGLDDSGWKSLLDVLTKILSTEKDLSKLKFVPTAVPDIASTVDLSNFHSNLWESVYGEDAGEKAAAKAKAAAAYVGDAVLEQFHKDVDSITSFVKEKMPWLSTFIAGLQPDVAAIEDLYERIAEAAEKASTKSRMPLPDTAQYTKYLADLKAAIEKMSKGNANWAVEPTKVESPKVEPPKAEMEASKGAWQTYFDELTAMSKDFTESFDKLYVGMLNTQQSALSDMIYSMTGGDFKSAFEQFVTDIGDSFRKLIADLLAEWLMLQAKMLLSSSRSSLLSLGSSILSLLGGGTSTTAATGGVGAGLVGDTMLQLSAALGGSSSTTGTTSSSNTGLSQHSLSQLSAAYNASSAGTAVSSLDGARIAQLSAAYSTPAVAASTPAVAASTSAATAASSIVPVTASYTPTAKEGNTQATTVTSGNTQVTIPLNIVNTLSPELVSRMMGGSAGRTVIENQMANSTVLRKIIRREIGTRK